MLGAGQTQQKLTVCIPIMAMQMQYPLHEIVPGTKGKWRGCITRRRSRGDDRIPLPVTQEETRALLTGTSTGRQPRVRK